MNRVSARIICCAVAAVTAAAAGAALLREDERVEELMERTHEGRRSPYRQVVAAAAMARPAWADVNAALPRFDAMARALLESPVDDIKDSADGYVDAVKDLAGAARRRDAEALGKAVHSLEQSCGDCHFKGGIGGELEHEEEEEEHEEEEEKEHGEEEHEEEEPGEEHEEDEHEDDD